MIYLGSVLQAFALFSGSLALLATLWGLWKKNSDILALARQAMFLHFMIVTGSMMVLLSLLLTPDFSVVYVAENVSRTLPLFYKLTSVWAGQAGSMLFWNFLLVLFSVIAIRQVERERPLLVPVMIAVLSSISIFFSLMANFSTDTDAFQLISQGGLPLPQPDGRGLNPLLQHWAMVIHPPVLYIGYVGFAIPFAIAMSVLVNRQTDDSWTRMVRKWNLFSWLFLGSGIVLGALWAYEELGWGGYWAWDPVENASLMPWISGTALLHSLMVQEKRGIFKFWNMILVSLTFLMSIFGTFITRSGLVTSVHAFPSSGLGGFFLVFMGLVAVFSLYWILRRAYLLKPERQITHLLSRESAFLFNNVFLLVILFTVIWGTMFPTITQLIYKEAQQTLDAAWFNKWIVPMGILLLFATGVGPGLSWEKTEKADLKRNFFWPGLGMVLVLLGYVALRVKILNDSQTEVNLENLVLLAGISFAVAAFLIVSVLQDFIRGTRKRTAITGENPCLAFLALLFQNKRRYIGFSIHLSLAILFIGFTGRAFTHEGKVTLAAQESETFQGYTIEVSSIEDVTFPPETKAMPLYVARKVSVNIYRDNQLWQSGVTEMRNYPTYSLQTGRYDQNQTTSEPGVFPSWSEDLYLQFGGSDEDNRVIISVWVNPLIRWIWVGFIVNLVFMVLMLLPTGDNGRLNLGFTEISLLPKPKAKSA